MEIQLQEQDLIYLNKLFDQSDIINKNIAALTVEKHKLCEAAIRIQEQYDSFKIEMIANYKLDGKDATVNLEKGIIEIPDNEEQNKTKEKSNDEKND